MAAPFFHVLTSTSPYSAKVLSAGLLISGIVFGGGLAVTPARAADEISIRIGGGQRSIEVSDLEFFVNTGEIPRSLRWYANRLTDQEITNIRQALAEPLPVEPRVVTRFTSSVIGEALLRRLLVAFWGGPTEDALFRALRSSLTLAAFDDGGMTPMSIIQNYPLSVIRIDLNVGLQAAEDLKEIFIDSEALFALVQNSAAQGLTNDTLPDNFLAPTEPGDRDWVVTEVVVTNPERSASEQVFVDVYVPTESTDPAPLVLISHGVASDRETFAYLAEHLASYGFAVGVMQHPDTDKLRLEQYFQGFGEEPDPRLFLQRPLDITAVLDGLASNPQFGSRVNTDAVGLFGQSLGGYTVLASGGGQLNFEYLAQTCQDASEKILPFNLSLLLQCQMQRLEEGDYALQDERVVAVLAVNPVGSAVFGQEGFAGIDVPVLMVAGTHDFFAPAVAEQIVPFTWLTEPNRHLVLVENGTHFSFLSDEVEGAFDLPQELIGPDPQLALPGMRWLATTFFNTYLNEDERYSEPPLSEVLLSSRTGEFRYAATRSLTSEQVQAVVAGE